MPQTRKKYLSSWRHDNIFIDNRMSIISRLFLSSASDGEFLLPIGMHASINMMSQVIPIKTCTVAPLLCGDASFMHGRRILHYNLPELCDKPTFYKWQKEVLHKRGFTVFALYFVLLFTLNKQRAIYRVTLFMIKSHVICCQSCFDLLVSRYMVKVRLKKTTVALALTNFIHAVTVIKLEEQVANKLLS